MSGINGTEMLGQDTEVEISISILVNSPLIRPSILKRVFVGLISIVRYFLESKHSEFQGLTLGVSY